MTYLEKCIAFVEENFEGDTEMQNLCASAIGSVANVGVTIRFARAAGGRPNKSNHP